jgi:hypothetical protein
MRSRSSRYHRIAAFVCGQFRRATELCERALTLLRDECTGVNWEMNLTQDFLLGALLFRGELRDVSHWLPGLLQAARERGNLYFETELRTRMNLVWLAADEPDEGERQANDAIGRWSASGFHRQHYNHLLARIQTALYRGRAEDAWQLVSEHLAPVRRNFWLRVQFFRIETAFLRARCALAMAAANGAQAKRLRAVAADAVRRLTRENMPWSNALALLVRATLARQQGDGESAAALLTDAIEAFTRSICTCMPPWRADGSARSWADNPDARCSARRMSGWPRRRFAIRPRWPGSSPRDFRAEDSGEDVRGRPGRPLVECWNRPRLPAPPGLLLALCLGLALRLALGFAAHFGCLLLASRLGLFLSRLGLFLRRLGLPRGGLLLGWCGLLGGRGAARPARRLAGAARLPRARAAGVPAAATVAAAFTALRAPLASPHPPSPADGFSGISASAMLDSRWDRRRRQVHPLSKSSMMRPFRWSAV